MGREDLEIDRLSIDALVASCDPCRLRFNLLLHLSKVIKLAPRQVVEFGPFVLTGNTSSRMWDMDLIGFRLIITFTGNVDKL